MSKIFAIVCEDNGHFCVITRLVDDSLVAAHDWLDGILDDCRHWRGMNDGERWYKYDPADANDLRPIEIGGLRIVPQGPIQGKPLKPEAGMWRRILLMFCHVMPRPDLVVLARDMDGDPRRREGIAQVIDDIEWPFPVVAATPEPEIEGWIVSGFVPQSDDEREALRVLRTQLSFDPTTEPHRLTSHPNDADRDAKRVLRALTGRDIDREAACLADRERLRSMGRDNGAVAFLDAVEQHVVPLFGGSR